MNWKRFLLGRAAALVGMLFAVTFIVFSLLFLAPGDPAVFLLGGGTTVNRDAIETVRAAHGLDLPLWEQYFRWLGHALTGDLGYSYQTRESVTGAILGRLPASILLIAIAAVFTIVGGVLLGIVSVLLQGHRLSGIVNGLITFGAGVPAFVSATLLVSLFAVNLGWFPASGAGTGLLGMTYHALLPAAALSFGYIPTIARVSASAMMDLARSSHVDVAMSRGLSKGGILKRHVIRNALWPMVNISGVQLIILTMVTVYVETIFALPGLGKLLIDAVLRKDFPVVQGVILLFVCFFVLVNSVVDALRPVVEPTSRVENRRE